MLVIFLIQIRFVFSKTWLCHHSKRHKRIAKRNADCKAKLSIVIKKITKATKKTDKYLKYDMPLVGEVKISLLHTHNTTSAETLRMLRVNNEVRQQFYLYFSDGVSAFGLTDLTSTSSVYTRWFLVASGIEPMPSGP
ncbi:hypothetical protein TNCT_105181 [Trichonephila clavata]|uniref:Uncharacterized protein n=1 Tax=Trichonephila clavata TaxID=2740835 RepID=A0A8X6L8P3_TRICU|nr:hypothetical protein TNCT_105181 [Trichonephila clavata]